MTISLRGLLALAAGLAVESCSSSASSMSPHRQPIVHNGAAHHEIVVFGDSLAIGVGASSRDSGFVPLLVARVRRTDPTSRVRNFAAGGATADDVLWKQLPRAAGSGATDVWLCVGGNDVARMQLIDRFPSTEHALVSALRRRFPGAHIVVFGVPDISRAPKFPAILRTHLHDDAALDNAAAADAARDAGADFVDLFSFSDRQLDLSADLSPDRFHPNDRGYAAIAEFSSKAVI
jgi:lysophospholipase L1-like esterase